MGAHIARVIVGVLAIVGVAWAFGVALRPSRLAFAGPQAARLLAAPQDNAPPAAGAQPPKPEDDPFAKDRAELLDPRTPDGRRAALLGQKVLVKAAGPDAKLAEAARRLVAHDLLKPTHPEAVLTSLLSALKNAVSVQPELLQSAYVGGLLRVRADSSFAAEVDAILALYPSAVLHAAVLAVLNDQSGIGAETGVLSSAAAVAQSPRFTVRQQLSFVAPLVARLGSAPQGGRAGLDRALTSITVHEVDPPGDPAAWQAWYAAFAKLPVEAAEAAVVQALRERIRELEAALQKERRQRALAELVQNKGSFPINLAALTESPDPAVIVRALGNLEALGTDADAQPLTPEQQQALREALTVRLTTHPDPGVRKAIAGPLLAVPGGEALLREHTTKETDPSVCAHALSLLSDRGREVATGRVLVSFVAREGTPSVVLIAALEGLGAWNHYTDAALRTETQRALTALVASLKAQPDSRIANALVNALNALPGKLDTAPVIEAVVSTEALARGHRLSIVRSGLETDPTRASLRSWLSAFERQRAWLQSILTDPTAIAWDVQAAVVILGRLADPFVSDGDEPLWRALVSRYAKTKPKGANGRWEATLGETWAAMAAAAPDITTTLTWLMDRGLAGAVLEHVVPTLERRYRERLDAAGKHYTGLKVRLRLHAPYRLTPADFDAALKEYRALTLSGAITPAARQADLNFAFALDGSAPAGLAERLLETLHPETTPTELWTTIAAILDAQLPSPAKDHPALTYRLRDLDRAIRARAPLKRVLTDAAQQPNLRAYLALIERAREARRAWAAETLAAWKRLEPLLKPSGAPPEIRAFYQKGENSRVVVPALYRKLNTLSADNPLARPIWDLIQTICDARGTALEATWPAAPADFAKARKGLGSELERAGYEL